MGEVPVAALLLEGEVVLAREVQTVSPRRLDAVREKDAWGGAGLSWRGCQGTCMAALGLSQLRLCLQLGIQDPRRIIQLLLFQTCGRAHDLLWLYHLDVIPI